MKNISLFGESTQPQPKTGGYPPPDWRNGKPVFMTPAFIMVSKQKI